MNWYLLSVLAAALLPGADAPKQGAEKPAATILPPSNFRNVIFRVIGDAPPRFAKVEFQGFLEPCAFTSGAQVDPLSQWPENNSLSS